MPLRIMVAERDPVLRELLYDILNDEHYQVAAYGIGNAVIATAEFWQPDLFIIDTRLPDIHGGVLCKNIKSHAQLSGTPVILASIDACSGCSTYQHRCDGFLRKPFDLMAFLNMVSDLTGRMNRINKAV
ncbi:response regulator [Mucilaginibacter sp. SJ]|uniref:response regulator n=1 Tax=Mucilaginibacter sp. SJ TaxID=3029053 RepID=UPI0023A923A5|nr:response regulator [Mucilaginibacter sp. SJ]WEA01778.1 response regulator [Mucilaginibacter sp. SJ]